MATVPLRRFVLAEAKRPMNRRASASSDLLRLSPRPPSATSTSRSYSKSEESSFGYQYPLAKEPPQVSQTQASEVGEHDHAVPTPLPPPPRTPEHAEEEEEAPSTNPENRFDRSGLTGFEIGAIRSQQRDLLPQKLSDAVLSAESAPIWVPDNLPSSELPTPETLLTKLSNGIRVVSQEASSSGLPSTVGVVSAVGSRFEKHPRQRGVTNLLEMLLFATPTTSFPIPHHHLAMNLGGASHFGSTGREQSVHCIDLLRPHVDEAFGLLQEVLLEPQHWTEEHVEVAKNTLGFQAAEAPHEIILGEALQHAAFGGDQQLGQPHFYMEENPELGAQVVQDFWNARFVNNPENIVVAGVGLAHDHLVRLAETHFGHMQQTPAASDAAVPSVYHGGQVNIERIQRKEDKEPYLRVSLALQTEGWHSDDLVTVCALQTLLGGGSSFSAGGPGKGMYSRLYRQVLNRHAWAESAEAFVAFHNEVGLFGLTGSATLPRIREILQVFAGHMLQLAAEPVTEEELDRARNMLRANILTQLESRLVLFEDLGRQVLTYGKRENVQETCEKIKGVTAAHIQDFARRALAAGPPSVAVVGPGAVADSSPQVPKHDEIASWFSNVLK